MSEMVERVARALWQKNQGHVHPSWETVRSLGGDNVWKDFARAAIEAMREPTDAMEKAGAAKWDDDWCTETNALNMWQEMIDEALK